MNKATKKALNGLHDAELAYVLFLEADGRKEGPIYCADKYAANSTCIDFYKTFDGNNNPSVKMMFLEVQQTLSASEAVDFAKNADCGQRIIWTGIY